MASTPSKKSYVPVGGKKKTPAEKPSAAKAAPAGWSQNKPSAATYTTSTGSSSSTTLSQSSSSSNQKQSNSNGNSINSRSRHHGHQHQGQSRHNSGASQNVVVLPTEDQLFPVIDIGANLAHRQFSSDLSSVLERAKAAKVSKIIVTGTSIRASVEALELAKQHPGSLYCTAGVHPHDAKSCNKNTIPKLRELASNPEVLAIGECGLDFDRNFSEPTVQEEWFVQQLQLAAELKKPVFLHERSAFKRFVEILESAHKSFGFDLTTAVVHCFTGTDEEVKKYLSMGVYIGITGWVTSLSRGKALREAVKLIPLDKIMIETDCPFLAPSNGFDADGHRVKIQRNEPEYLQLVVEDLANLMGVSVEELSNATTANAKKFFRIPDQ